MSLLHLTVSEFLEQVDSKKPAPGGGSVSALSSVLGVSLAKMVGHLTIGRKAYRALDEEKQQLLIDTFDQLDHLKQQLLPLIDQDTEAFNQIMSAYRLPKETEEEKTLRSDAIQEATLRAIEVPMKVAILSLDALNLLFPLVKYGNQNALSDVGVSALELSTGANGALYNVNINLPSLNNDVARKNYKIQADKIEQDVTVLVEQITSNI